MPATWVQFPDGYGRWNTMRLDRIVALIDNESPPDEEFTGPKAQTLIVMDAHSFEPINHGWVDAPRDEVLHFLVLAQAGTEPVLRFQSGAVLQRGVKR